MHKYTIIILLGMLLSSCDTNVSHKNTPEQQKNIDDVYGKISYQNSDGVGVAYNAKSRPSKLDLNEEKDLDQKTNLDLDNENK